LQYGPKTLLQTGILKKEMIRKQHILNKNSEEEKQTGNFISDKFQKEDATNNLIQNKQELANMAQRRFSRQESRKRNDTDTTPQYKNYEEEKQTGNFISDKFHKEE